MCGFEACELGYATMHCFESWLSMFMNLEGVEFTFVSQRKRNLSLKFNNGDQVLTPKHSVSFMLDALGCLYIYLYKYYMYMPIYLYFI